MAITDTLSDVWHSLEDKTWGLADFLEDKGIPISSFCEDKGISPIYLFGGVVLAILVLFMVMGGAAGQGGNAILKITIVDENSEAVKSIDFNLVSSGGISKPGKTGLDGKETLGELAYGTYTIKVETSKYVGTKTVTVDSEDKSVTVTIASKKGSIEVTARSKTGDRLTAGSIEVRELDGDLVESKSLDGSSSYTFEVPVGVYKVLIKSTSGGEISSETTDVKADEIDEIDFEVDASAADSSSVKVLVKDEKGSVVPDVYVQLWNGRNDASIGEQQRTDSAGETTFSNIAVGTSVYPTAIIPSDKRYGDLDKYNSKLEYRKTVYNSQELIEVVLPLNGRVEVTVWDQESKAFISGATVTIKNLAGEVISEDKNTNSEGVTTFSGFEENIEVYPVVIKQGYMNYENSQEARPIRYSSESIRFTASLERDESVILSRIDVSVVDIFDDEIEGVDAFLSEAGGPLVSTRVNSDNITFEVDGNLIYNLALFKEGLLRTLTEGLSAGTQTVQMKDSNPTNSGEVKICTYMNINGEDSQATATIDLYLGTGALIASDATVGGSDGDNCITFGDVPQEWSVYAKATNDGYSPVETDITEVKPSSEGVTELNISFNSLPPNAPIDGDIKVCVKGSAGEAVSQAEVLLYDFDLDSPSWTGDYRLATASDGCVIFTNLPTEKTNYQGVLSPVLVYPIVSSTGYATYNGKNEGSLVEVQAQRTTPINVILSEGESICINVMSSGAPLEGVDVSLCATPSCSQYLDTQDTESDGHVLFSADVSSVTVKAVANLDALTKETIESFSLSDVTKGQCGDIELSAVSQYASISIDGITSTYLEVIPGSSNEIEFIARVDGDAATGGAMLSGGENKIFTADNVEIAINLEGDDFNVGSIRTVSQEDGKYAVGYIAPSLEDIYQLTLSASITSCDTCQDYMQYLTVDVTDGDDDGDGILNEEDNCPGTDEDASVDGDGCPVASDTDADGDGISDEMDQCAGTSSGVRVDSVGCEIVEVSDLDGDGIPDEYDAYPTDSSQWYSTTDTTTASTVADQYANYQETSVQICIEDEDGVPIYDSDVVLYHTGGTGGNSANYANSPSSQTQYGQGYGQAWQNTYRNDNCKVFIGYSSVSNLYLNSFLTSFNLQVGANGYQSYNSVSGGSTSLSMSSGTAGSMFSLTVKLKRGASSKIGAGTITNPAREVELISDTWKAQTDEEKTSTNLYPLVTMIDKNINLIIKYSISSSASDTIDYSLDYKVKGNNCYELDEGETDITSKRTLQFNKGQSNVEDTIVLRAKESCWNDNNPELENEFTIELGGNLLQIGDKEATAKNKFTVAKVKLNPVIGATKEIDGLSDIQELNNILTLSDGVVTTGTLPYCINEAGKTGDSRVVSSRGISDRTAADYKIVIEFKGTNIFPDDLGDFVGKISDLIRNKLRKSPLDCKTYVNVDDKYMGHLIVGQKGFSCNDAVIQVGAKQAQPWEKLFCDAIASGTSDQVQLGGSYSMEVNSQ